MTKLLIIGTGGQGKVAADCAENMGCYSEIAFMDSKSPEKTEFGPWPIVSSQQLLANDTDPNLEYFVAIGDNQTRQKVTDELSSVDSIKLATLVHPSATVSRHSTIGSGSIVCANAFIGPMSKVGKGCIVNTGASIDHDCIVGDFVHVSVGARLAGSVKVGSRTFLCIGSVISNNIDVGNDCIVGAGATVIREISNDLTVVGTPARPI